MDLTYKELLDILKLAPRLQNVLEGHGIFTMGDLLHRRTIVTRPCRGVTPPNWRDLPHFRQDPSDHFDR